MSNLVKTASKLVRWPMFQRINMFRYHWRAYVGHLEGEEGIESRFYYLGFGFILSIFGFLVSAVDIIGIYKKYAWLQEPWYESAVFVNYFPKEVRTTQTFIWFCYFLEAVLGLGYELARDERAPTFMRIYTPRGQAALGKDGYQAKFRRFQAYCMAVTYASTYSFSLIVMITFIIYGYIKSYSLNWAYVFWVVYTMLQTSSGIYIFVTVPFLLIMSAYYLHLLQQMLVTNTKALRSKPIKNRTIMMKSYEQIVATYVSTNQLLTEFSKFWSFYLYVWIQIYPIMITYFIYNLVNNKVASMVWSIIYLFTIITLANNLFVAVHVCTQVSKKNREIANHVVYIFRHNLQASLTGDLRRHIHLQGTVDHIRLSKYFLRSISNQIIDTKTYFTLTLKFAFIYMKLTNLAKESST